MNKKKTLVLFLIILLLLCLLIQCSLLNKDDKIVLRPLVTSWNDVKNKAKGISGDKIELDRIKRIHTNIEFLLFSINKSTQLENGKKLQLIEKLKEIDSYLILNQTNKTAIAAKLNSAIIDFDNEFQGYLNATKFSLSKRIENFGESGVFIAIIDGIKSVPAWPLVVLSMFLFLVLSKTASARIANLFKPFRSIKVAGTELTFQKEEEAYEFKKRFEDTIQLSRKEAQRLFDHKVKVNRINEKMRDIIENKLSDKYIKEYLGGSYNHFAFSNFRFTIHVQDILFENRLYQLVDYYPGGGEKKRGRTLSIRFGIIGRAWRSGEPQLDGQVKGTEEALVDKWGMTKEEAKKAGLGRKTFICIILRDKENTAVGIFYGDCEEEQSDLKNEDLKRKIIQLITQSAHDNKLITSLASLNKELREVSPLISKL